jgi:FixJ family two-component response regulator
MLASGARAFLQKPFSMYDLIDLIRKVAPMKKPNKEIRNDDRFTRRGEFS